MKIIKYIGGLGNQMFIYAFSYLLQSKFNETIYADTSYYKSHRFHNGLEIENIFDIKLNVAKTKDILKLTWYFPNYYIDYHMRKFLPCRKNHFQEPQGGAYMPEVLENVSHRYYFGFWQNHQYYDDIRNDLQKVFIFRPSLSGENLSLYAMLQSSEQNVGIHVRRGDYVNHPLYRGICTIDYYRKAIEKIKEIVSNPIFYIFSDDILWCKTNIEPMIDSCKFFYVDWNRGEKSFYDMQLMTQCKHLIIANSSFSWWAAYINTREPTIIAPEKWINRELDFKIQLDDWILL